MELQHKLLHEKHEDLDTMSTISKENIVFGQKEELKIEKQQDVAIQVDLVCVMCSILVNYGYVSIHNY